MVKMKRPYIRKVTRWFPVVMKPRRRGVYQVRATPTSAAVLYADWRGTHWAPSRVTADEAAAVPRGGQSEIMRANPYAQWRGKASRV